MKKNEHHRRRLREFGGGQFIQVTLRFASTEQNAALKELLESTNEVWLDDAIHTVLESIANTPGQYELAAMKQTHLHLLRDYAKTLDAEFSRALKNAEQAAQNEITKLLLERGIYE